MGERKGQGLYNRLYRRLKTGNTTISDSLIVQYLYNIDNSIFDEIMDNVMKDNQCLTKEANSS